MLGVVCLLSLLGGSTVIAQKAPHPVLSAPAGGALPGLGGGGNATGTVTGRISGTQPGAALQGAPVELRRFTLTADGTPEEQWRGEALADAAGAYRFAAVPVVPRSVYLLAASIGGVQLRAQPFAFSSTSTSMEVDLLLPHKLTDTSGLQISEALVVVEPGRGFAWVTEVLHLLNPSPSTVDASGNPLALWIPAAAERLDLMGETAPDSHERLGPRLLLSHQFAPGRSSVVFRYRVPIWLGALALEQRYPLPVDTVSVMAPAGALKFSGAGFTAQETRDVQGAPFEVWMASSNFAAETKVAVRLSGVPLAQEVLLLPLAGFFVLMAGIVWWFLRKRLPSAHPKAEAA